MRDQRPTPLLMAAPFITTRPPESSQYEVGEILLALPSDVNRPMSKSVPRRSHDQGRTSSKRAGSGIRREGDILASGNPRTGGFGRPSEEMVRPRDLESRLPSFARVLRSGKPFLERNADTRAEPQMRAFGCHRGARRYDEFHTRALAERIVRQRAGPRMCASFAPDSKRSRRRSLSRSLALSASPPEKAQDADVPISALRPTCARAMRPIPHTVHTPRLPSPAA